MAISEEAPSAPKRIVVCCDGTWQSAVSGNKNIPSNVTRLCRSLARAGTGADGKIWEQIVFYDSGVGTGALSSLDSARQGNLGGGLAVNVLEAYNFIVLNYAPGDEIFCFGFSRGAYTARAVAGIVADIGICEPRTLNLFPEVYAAYKRNVDGKPFRETTYYTEWRDGKVAADSPAPGTGYKVVNNIKWEIPPHGDIFLNDEATKVKFVGVWDTVGALGIPDIQEFDLSWLRKAHGFHNVRLSSNIENASHALALDERRGSFSPTLWYVATKDEEIITDKETGKIIQKPTNLTQCWFPGVHINSGGGSGDTMHNKNGDLEQIASITFAWMVEQTRPFLAFRDNVFYQMMKEHDLLLESIAKEYVPPTWSETIHNAIPFAASVEPHLRKVIRGWGTGPILNTYTGMLTKLIGAADRKPMETVDSQHRLLSTLGKTHEEIHPVVAYRMQHSKAQGTEYAPAGLEGWERVYKKEKSSYFWVKGEMAIREHKMEKTVHDNLEWLTTDMPAREWLEKQNGIA